MTTGRTLGALGALVALVLVSCDRGPVLASPPPAGPFVSGTPVFEANGWIEYIPGDAPLIIVAPHGGRSRPFRLPERKCGACIDGNDSHTMGLARLVADSFATRTGHRPHLVLNLLDRSEFDANRDMLEATAGNHALEPTWNWLHASIDSAKAATIRQAGRGLVIDLHAHAHEIDRVEVGYLLAAYTFQQSDDTIVAEAPDWRPASIRSQRTRAPAIRLPQCITVRTAWEGCSPLPDFARCHHPPIGRPSLPMSTSTEGTTLTATVRRKADRLTPYSSRCR